MDTQFLIDLLTTPDPFADEPKVDAVKVDDTDYCLCGQPCNWERCFEMCDECNDRITSKYGPDPMPR
jgi:hypothetical protein